MPIDAIACERQFIDHAAPVWRALPDWLRGRFLTDQALVDHARSRGVEAEAIDAETLRRSSRPPMANLGPGPAAFVTSIGDTKIARRLGYRRFAFLEHGAGQAYKGENSVAAKNPSYAGGMDREDTELFLVPNEYSADLWRTAYPAARVEVVGCPKLDELPRREPGPGPLVAITFHWPAFVAPEADTALGHYWKVMPELAKTFTVIGTAHPKGDWPDRMARYYRRWGIEFVADFEEVCHRSDLLIFDNTSAGFEFAATGRPVVVLNSPKYRRKVHHGGRFWDWATVGIQVDHPDQLAETVQDALSDPPEVRMARETTLDLIYAHRADAARRAANALASWAESEVVRAA